MSIIGKNIKKIRVVKKISQADFAKLFQLSRGSVGSYEEGRAEPKIETIIRIANYFGLSIDLLLTKELTVNELYKFDIFKDEYAPDDIKEVPVRDKDLSKEDTPIVKKEVYIEYIVNCQNKDYINNLPFVRLPDTQHEKSRAFEVGDAAMEFNDKGLHQSDILSCAPVNDQEYNNLQPGSVYVIVDRMGIQVRRFKQSGKILTFLPDNPNFEPIEIFSKDILELWKVEGFYSTILKPFTLLEERMAIVERKMLDLERQMKSLLNQKNM